MYTNFYNEGRIHKLGVGVLYSFPRFTWERNPDASRPLKQKNGKKPVQNNRKRQTSLYYLYDCRMDAQVGWANAYFNRS